MHCQPFHPNVHVFDVSLHSKGNRTQSVLSSLSSTALTSKTSATNVQQSEVWCNVNKWSLNGSVLPVQMYQIHFFHEIEFASYYLLIPCARNILDISTNSTMSWSPSSPPSCKPIFIDLLSLLAKLSHMALLKSVKCYPGGRKIDLISSISEI